MSINTFGHLFRVTTWGESHGGGIGVVIDGCPPRLPLSECHVASTPVNVPFWLRDSVGSLGGAKCKDTVPYFTPIFQQNDQTC